tara:strand:+ start:2062 stop:2676 length:615 start_codon:yes stop_codon:yes gene_type:complete
MKSTEMINQIKTLLNIEVKLEETKLENGTIVSAESFEKDKEIFIVTDDEKVAMPVGEYLLEDGRLVVVSEEGMIADVREVSDEVPAKETEEGEEITSDLEEDKKEDKKEEMGYATKEELSSAVAEIKANIDEIKEMMKPKEEDLSDDVEKSLKSRTVKEEFSEAASKPIKHNPEGETKTKNKMDFAKGKFNSTAMERVLNKLNK